MSNELRRDYVLDRFAIIAPARTRRPTDYGLSQVSVGKDGSCPFCPGNEEKTPPSDLLMVMVLVLNYGLSCSADRPTARPPTGAGSVERKPDAVSQRVSGKLDVQIYHLRWFCQHFSRFSQEFFRKGGNPAPAPNGISEESVKLNA